LLQDLLIAPADGIGIAQGSSAGEQDPGILDSAQGPSAENRSISSAGEQDLRVLDPAQITPQKSLAGSIVAERSQPLPTIDLTPFCWILILLIFVTERILSFRSPKIKTNG
jgi:hypothetical protein